MIGCELQFNIVLGKCEWSRHHPCIVTSKERKNIISFNFKCAINTLNRGVSFHAICQQEFRVKGSKGIISHFTGIVYQTLPKKKVVKVGNNHLSRKI